MALIPIIEKAGGVVTTFDGGPAEKGGDIVAAATPELHRGGDGGAARLTFRLFLCDAIPKGKRYALFPGKPLRTFPGIAVSAA